MDIVNQIEKEVRKYIEKYKNSSEEILSKYSYPLDKMNYYTFSCRIFA